jgi:serine/threonine-protein kinase
VNGAVVDVPRGFRAGAWRVREHIASGAWGSVYAARGEDGTEAALKFIAGGLLSPSQYAQLEEARFNEQADHPGLVRTLETFVVEDPSLAAVHGSVVIAMERGERNLQDALGDVDPVPVITAVCEALAHIHASGWVHGDLKPSNVLLMADGSARLADFGLARELEGTHAYAPRVGSSDFLPPEWWSERISERGIPVRPTVDIWALGVTIHQLLTGGLYPFPGADARARGAAAQAYADGRAPLRLADELPPEWRPIVADCLARDHAARLPHTAASILARIPGRARTRRRRWPALAAVSAAAAAAVGVALASILNGPDASGAPVTVFNAEAACRYSHSDDCRLGLAGDPFAAYAPANVVGRVRHGDRLVAECYVSGATTVTAEDGRSSDRWYRMRTSGGEAWLPAVRLAPPAPPVVARCGG